MSVTGIIGVVVLIAVIVLYFLYVHSNTKNSNKMSAEDILKSGGMSCVGTVKDIQKDGEPVTVEGIRYVRSKLTISLEQDGINKDFTTEHMIGMALYQSPITVGEEIPVVVNFSTGDCALPSD